jgi:hypothetical protein
MPRNRAPTFFKVEIRRSTRHPARPSSPELALAGGHVAAAERLFGRPTTSIPTGVIKNGGRELREEPTKASDPTEGVDGVVTKTPRPIRVLPDLKWRDPVEERICKEAEDRVVRRRAVRVRRPARRKRAEQSEASDCRSGAGSGLTNGQAANGSIEVGEARSSAPAEPIRPAPDALSTSKPISAPKPKRSGNLRVACRRAEKRGLPLPRLPAGSRWKRRLPWMCW